MLVWGARLGGGQPGPHPLDDFVHGQLPLVQRRAVLREHFDALEGEVAVEFNALRGRERARATSSRGADARSGLSPRTENSDCFVIVWVLDSSLFSASLNSCDRAIIEETT